MSFWSLWSIVIKDFDVVYALFYGKIVLYIKYSTFACLIALNIKSLREKSGRLTPAIGSAAFLLWQAARWFDYITKWRKKSYWRSAWKFFFLKYFLLKISPKGVRFLGDGQLEKLVLNIQSLFWAFLQSEFA